MKKPYQFLWGSIFLAHLPVAFGGSLLVNYLAFFWVYPLFAMYLHLGYTKTSCLASYLVRLGLCGLLSQPLWVAYFERPWYFPNPVLTLLAALVVYHAVNDGHWHLMRPRWSKVARAEYLLYPGHLAVLLVVKALWHG